MIMIMTMTMIMIMIMIMIMYRPVRKLGKNEVPGMDGAHTVQHSGPHLVYKESYVFLMNYLNDYHSNSYSRIYE